MARPKKKIDPEQIKQLAMIGCTLEEMAQVLGCHRATLDRRFATVIKEGWNLRNMSLRRKQFEVAMGGSVGMLVWLGKQFLGQKDKGEVSGPDGGPIAHTVEHQAVVDLSQYSDDELEQFQQLLERGIKQQPQLLPGSNIPEGPIIQGDTGQGAAEAERNSAGEGPPASA